MLVVGIVSPWVAFSAISWPTILLILGMMLITTGMEASGLFEWISYHLVRAASTPVKFVVYVSLITAFLSSIVLNDAVVLILTPVIIRSARSLDISPVPPLVMEAISANIGSAATEVGNPQNAFIANASGIGFQLFTAHLLPVTALSLALAILFGVFISRGDFKKPVSISAKKPQIRTPKPAGPMVGIVAIVVAVLFSFFVLPLQYIPLVAMIGGAASILVIQFTVGSATRRVAVGVDWGILLFFIGLFILVQGLDSSGVIGLVVSSVSSVNGNAVTSVGGVSLLSAVLSNMVSNVPTVVLLSHVIGQSARNSLWFALAASSTFAGNATIVGAAANVIVVRRSAREGVTITLRTFMKYGLPVTLVSLLIAVAILRIWP